jgi:hypothetical protein
MDFDVMVVWPCLRLLQLDLVLGPSAPSHTAGVTQDTPLPPSHLLALPHTRLALTILLLALSPPPMLPLYTHRWCPLLPTSWRHSYACEAWHLWPLRSSRSSASPLPSFALLYAHHIIHPSLTPSHCPSPPAPSHTHTQVVSATPRQLEALIRLSEAWARMGLRDTVTVADVDHAYQLWFGAMSRAARDAEVRRPFWWQYLLALLCASAGG